ncbi:hypothetical protein BH09PSE4_BH09PSE4_16250 [soil metagenome]
MPGLSRSAVEACRPLIESEAFGQLVRFAVAGVGVTLLSVLVYIGAAVPLHANALLANALSHAVGVLAGYSIHSRWSFRSESSDARMMVRFTIASGFAFLLNSIWVWMAVELFHLSAWAPVPAMIFATPLASFALNRYWVFRAA